MLATSATSAIAGIRYRSGREIFAGRNPEAGQFVTDPENARIFPDPAAAADASRSLAKALEIRNYDAIKLFTRALDPTDF